MKLFLEQCAMAQLNNVDLISSYRKASLDTTTAAAAAAITTSIRADYSKKRKRT